MIEASISLVRVGPCLKALVPSRALIAVKHEADSGDDHQLTFLITTNNGCVIVEAPVSVNVKTRKF